MEANLNDRCIIFIFSSNCENPKINISKLKYNSSLVTYKNKKFCIIVVNYLKANDIEEIIFEFNKISYKIEDIKIFNMIKYKINFLFHHKVKNIKENKSIFMNDLVLEDEFLIYYDFCEKNKNKNEFLNFLALKSVNILESESKDSTFNFFIIIHNKVSKYFDSEINLSKIKYIGDLKEYKKSDFEEQKIYVLYKILKDFESLLNNKLFD